MYYIYDPFPGNDDHAMDSDRTYYVNRPNKPATAVVSNVDLKNHLIQKNLLSPHPRPLAVVQNADTLIINAHGSASSQIIGASYNKKGMRTMSALDLATHLRKDGLSPQHVTIKLISCYASGNAREQGVLGAPRNVVPCDHFSRALAMELGNMGYASVVVSGYQGEISRHATQGIIYTYSKEKVKGTKIKYDASGHAVA